MKLIRNAQPIVSLSLFLRHRLRYFGEPEAPCFVARRCASAFSSVARRYASVTPCFQLRGKTLCLCALYFQLSYCEAASEDFCFAAPLMPKNATGGMLMPDLAELTN